MTFGKPPLPTLRDRFAQAARLDPDRLFELGAELARGHATLLGIPGVTPACVELLACPTCHHPVFTHDGDAACTCGWRGTITEACQ